MKWYAKMVETQLSYEVYQLLICAVHLFALPPWLIDVQHNHKNSILIFIQFTKEVSGAITFVLLIKF